MRSADVVMSSIVTPPLQQHPGAGRERIRPT
jgi:hypothetical protein